MDKLTRDQCSFSLIGGNATSTYQFQTGFYGLTAIPAEFQRAIDLTLTNCSYLDDILIVTKGSFDIHKQKLDIHKQKQMILKKLDAENLAISLDKYKLACKQVEWLGYTKNSEGTKPLIRKTEAVKQL